MVELFPAVLPIFLLHTGGVKLVVDAAVFQALLKQGQHFGGVFIGGQVHVYDDHVPGFVQQFLLDQVYMGDLPRLLFQVAVILNINAAVGHHGGDSLGRIGVALGNGNADVGPFHKKEPPIFYVSLL